VLFIYNDPGNLKIIFTAENFLIHGIKNVSLHLLKSDAAGKTL